MNSTELALMLVIASALACPTQMKAADTLQAAAKSIVVTVQNGILHDPIRDAKSDKPSEPDRPDSSTVNPEVKDLVTSFEQSRDVFVSQQKELTAELKGAADDQRQKIRDELKKSQDQFAVQREQFRDQLKEAQEKLRDYAKKLKDEMAPAKGTGKPRGA